MLRLSPIPNISIKEENDIIAHPFNIVIHLK